MYFYLFDQCAFSSKFEKQTELITLKLADLGILHDKARASSIRPIEILTREILTSDKYKNIIAVGTDKTAHFVANEILKAKKEVNFGFIPEEKSEIGELWGLNVGVEACNVISRRHLKKIDVGWVDYSFFLIGLEVVPQIKQEGFFSKFFHKFFANHFYPEIEIELKNVNKTSSGFKIITPIKKIFVANFLTKKITNEIRKYVPSFKIKNSPVDGLLDVFIFSATTSQSSFSYFRAKTIDLKSQHPLLYFIDNQKVAKSSSHIVVRPQSLNIFVGKNRIF